MEKLRLTLNSSLAEIAGLSEAFAGFAERCRLPGEAQAAMSLALEEMVSNIIRHGSMGQESQPIVIDLAVQEGELVASIQDRAVPFNPLEAPRPDLWSPLQHRKPGGLGIYLVKNLMDAVEYRHEDGENILVLRKRL